MDYHKELAWHIVEAKVAEEISWLKQAIPEFKPHSISGPKEESDIATCNCDYRRLALLIVTGSIIIRQLNSSGGKLWGRILDSNSLESKHKHGHEWHRRMMDALEIYFSADEYEVITEPNLTWGRADLGLFRKGEHPLYVEIGTTSIKKLAINVQAMKGSDFLLVPDEDRAIEIRA